MIPSNFDIDAHLVNYPLTDYKFIVDNAGHIKSVNLNGTVGAVFDKDRLIYKIDENNVFILACRYHYSDK